MKTTKLELDHLRHFEFIEYEDGRKDMYLELVEEACAHGYSDRKVSLDISPEQAAALISFLQKVATPAVEPEQYWLVSYSWRHNHTDAINHEWKPEMAVHSGGLDEWVTHHASLKAEKYVLVGAWPITKEKYIQLSVAF